MASGPILGSEQQQLIDNHILQLLREHGAQMLDQLDKILPDIGSARFLLAIDRLSRAGKIHLASPRNGDYLVSAVPETGGVYTAF